MIMLLFLLCLASHGWSQPCVGAPSYTINLTGRPDSTWTSPAVTRSGDCCGSSSPDRCIEFILTLDSQSSGIRLDIPTGALPGGALFYQIGCGTSYQVGTEICLSGVGPHRITFCKPGNNDNTYQIKAIPKPKVTGKLLITQACIGNLKAVGLVTSSITWQSVPNNATHNSYLSCLSGCDSVSIIPSGSYPPTVTYRVCGQVIGGCAGATFCDTATVQFVTNTSVTILPKDAAVCFGGATTSITANPVGGLAPFHFNWNTGATTQSINVTPGTYYVSMTDSLGCSIVRDTVTVTGFALPIDANAGNDTAVCTRLNSIVLNGVVQAASGGRWLGGTGTFVPNDTTLNAIYYPSSAETLAGGVRLKLLTTGNKNCPPDSDTVDITIKQSPTPTISGPSIVCEHKTTTYSTVAMSGSSYNWTVSGGVIQGSITDTFIQVKWGPTGTGSVILKQTNAQNCDSTVSKTITIHPTPLPVLSGPSGVCERKTTTYSVAASINNTYLWTVNGGVIQGSNTDTFIQVKWGPTGMGSVTLKQTNAQNCDSTVSKTITIDPTPVPVLSGPSMVCEYKTTTYSVATAIGNSYVWTVSGGSIQGINTDTFIQVKWGPTGMGTVTLKETNAQNCDSTVSKSITIDPTPVPVLSGPSTVCEYKTTTYSVATAIGNSYVWTVSGGSIQGNNTDTFIQVKWGPTGMGSVTLKQTNAQNCDSTVSKTIIIDPTPVPVLSGPSTVCEYKTTTYSVATAIGNSYVWTVSGGSIQGSNTDTFIQVKWGPTGMGTVTLKETNAQNCDSTVSKTITIDPTPVPVLSGPSTVCEYKTTTYSVASAIGNSYVWTVSGGLMQGSNTDTFIQVKWGPTGMGIVTIKQTNAQNCDSTVSKTITIHSTPVPTLSGPSIACEYKITTYSIAAASGNNYAWTVNGGVIQGSNTDTFIQVKWGPAGTGTVTIKQTNAQNCDSTVNKTITINPTPVAMINGPDSSCAFKIKQYTTPTVSGNSYKWQITGGVISGIDTLPQVTVIWSNSPITFLSLRITNSSGCDSTVTKNIVVANAPIPSVKGDTLVCSLTKYSYSSVTIPGATYKWTVLAGTIVDSSFDTSIQVVWGNGTDGIIRLLVNNAQGCDSSVEVRARIVPRVQSTIIGPDTVCARKVQRYSVPKIEGHTYQWSVTGGNIQGTTNDTILQVLWNTPGTQTVSLYEKSEADCDSTITITVTVEPTPIPAITGTSAICAFKRATYSAPFKTANTYAWEVAGGLIENTVSDTQILVLWGGPIAGTVKLRQTNGEGCDSTVVLQVNVKPTPDPIIFGSNKVCANRLMMYSTNATIGNTYQWSVSGGGYNTCE